MLNKTNVNEILNQKCAVTLWGVRVSPYVRKVMVALAEKEIVYEQKEILPKILLNATGQVVPVEFEKASPLGKIPALQVDDFCIADSAVIIGYLERRFSTRQKLYPHNPENYARALWFERYADNVLTEVIYKDIFLECIVKPKVLNLSSNKDIVDHAKTNKLPAILDYLEQSVSYFDWIAGDEFSSGDIAIATQLLALTMSGFAINKWSALNRYLNKVTARASFQKIMAS